VVVRDTFPTNGFNFVSAVAQQGAGDDRTFTNNGSSLNWSIPFLPSGNSATLVITANISAAGVQTNSAEVMSSDQDDPDSSPANGNLSEDDMGTVDVNVGGAVVTADLQISKTDGLTNAVPGSPVTYTIVVTNDAGSPSDIVGAVVEDIFDPTFFDVPNVSWTCAITSGTGACGNPGPVLGDIVNETVDLNIGSSATFTVTAPLLANASGTISNIATVTAPTGVTETNPNNNSAVDNNTALSAEADLSLTTTVDNPTPNIGDLVTFTVEVTNSGPSDAANVNVRDILPSGYTFNLAGTSASQGSYNNATGDWTVGTLAISAPVQTLSLAATVNSTGNYLNIAQVWTSDAPDLDSAPANDVTTEDDYAEASITVTEADLSIASSVDNLTPVPGQNVTFTLAVSNSGPSVASSVIIEDRLPTGFTYVSSNIVVSNGDETPVACSNVNEVVTCELNSIDPLVDEIIQIVAFSNPSTEGTTQTNVVEIISATEFDPNSVHGNNVLAEDDQDSIDIVVSSANQANLSLTKSTSNPEPTESESFDYTVVISNAGPADATNVEIVDTLPAGLTFVSAAVAGGDFTENCSLVGQALTCSLGTVAALSPETVTITVSVDAGQGGNTITNTVEVTEVDNSDPNSIKNNGDTTEDDYAEVDVVVSLVPQGFTVTGHVFNDVDVNGNFTPNDSGISGITVVLLNNAAGTCLSVETDGEGLYSFTSIVDGNYTVYESADERLPAPNSCPPNASDPANHRSVTANTIPFSVAGADVTGLDFADVLVPSLTGQNASSIEPGNSVVYSHRFTAQTDGNVDFEVLESTTPANDGWSNSLHIDNSCDAQLGGDDPLIAGSLTVNAGDSVCVLVKVNSAAPSTAGSRHVATLVATFTFADPSNLNHGLESSLNRIDTTTITAAAVGRLVLEKFVENLSEGGAQLRSNQADSSDVLRYTVEFENVGAGGVSDLTINDATPAFTSLAATITCPAPMPPGITSCTVQVPSPAANTVGYTGPIEWQFEGTDCLIA